MAANGNGKMFKIVMYLVGVFVMILVSSITFIGRNVIANDKESRIRDQRLDNKIHKVIEKQQVQNDNTNIQLAKILTELKYISREKPN